MPYAIQLYPYFGAGDIGIGSEILAAGWALPIPNDDWVQAYVVPSGGGTGGNAYAVGNVVTHGRSQVGFAIGARELVSASSLNDNFRYRADSATVWVADGTTVDLIVEQYRFSTGATINTARINGCTWRTHAFLHRAIAAQLFYSGLEAGQLQEIHDAVIPVYHSPL